MSLGFGDEVIDFSCLFFIKVYFPTNYLNRFCDEAFIF